MYDGLFKDKTQTAILLRHVLDASEDSESDNDSVSSMKDGRKKVQFTDSENENKPDMIIREGKKTNVWKRCRKTPNFKLMLLSRGDIPGGSDAFRQVLKEIKSVDSNADSDKISPDSDRSLSPPGKSILKKR